MKAHRLLPMALLLFAATAAAQEPPEGSPPPLPPELQEAFAARTEAGEAVVPDALQAWFRDRPAQVQRLFAAKLRQEMIGGPGHLARLLSLQLSGQELELLLTDNCILCHSNPDQQLEHTLLLSDAANHGASEHMDLESFIGSAHFRRGLSCSGCHGGSPEDTEMTAGIYARWPEADAREASRAWIPGFCARCHAKPQLMRRFAPGLPTDQLAKYRTSHHGELLLEEGDSKAAQCVSCHGSHGIRGAESPRSTVHPLNVAGTCGACHGDPAYMAGYTVGGEPIPTDQRESWRQSVHGRAVVDERDFGAPTCNDCHGNHAAMPPEVASVAQICRTCHSAPANWFDASAHKQPFREHGWPECVQCHGKHLVNEATEAMLANTPGTVCYDCHRVYAPDNPVCNTMPDYFRTRLEGLRQGLEHYEARSEDLAEMGLDVEPLRTSMSTVEDALRQSRTRVHGFERSLFDETAEVGAGALGQARSLVEHLRAEYRFRTLGLLLAVGLMAILAAAVWIRVRTMERRPRDP